MTFHPWTGSSCSHDTTSGSPYPLPVERRGVARVGLGEPRSQAAVGRSDPVTPASPAAQPRPSLLGPALPPGEGLACLPDDRQARQHRTLAPQGLRAVLALAIQKASRTSTDRPGDPGPHLANGSSQPAMGSAASDGRCSISTSPSIRPLPGPPSSSWKHFRGIPRLATCCVTGTQSMVRASASGWEAWA